MSSREGRTEKALRAVATRVRERRLELGISQEELALRAGLHRTYVSDIERGNRNIAITNVVRLADALQLPVADIFSAEIFLEPDGGRGDD
jgi:transcriptional regulator with XRE-family HTH domain